MGEFVRILKPNVVDCVEDLDEGSFDYSQCADRTFRRCHSDACMDANWGENGGGRRRAQAGTCDANNLPGRAADVNAECCDEPSERCEGEPPPPHELVHRMYTVAYTSAALARVVKWGHARSGGYPTTCNEDCAAVRVLGFCRFVTF